MFVGFIGEGSHVPLQPHMQLISVDGHMIAAEV